jgi:hypothetical protein
LNLLENKPATPQFRGSETFDLAAWKVQPGSRIDYWLTVRDTKEPTANRFETARQVIEVIAPLPPAEKAKFEETAKKELEPDQAPTPDRANPAENPEQPPPADGRPGEAERDQGEPNPQKKQGAEEVDPKNPGAVDRQENADPANAANNEPQRPEKPPTAEEQRKLEKLQQALERMRQAQGQQPPPAGAQQNAPNPGNAGQTAADTQAARNGNNAPNPNQRPSDPAARGQQRP